MEIKTYSRARAAKAALLKILDMHEVAVDKDVFVFVQEVAPGRFTAQADFTDCGQVPAQGLMEDLTTAGFAANWTVPAPEAAAPDVLPSAGELADELDALGVEPKAPRKPTYVAETSTAEGPTKRVWAIADSMPGATRKQVIDACRAACIAFGTARTQYQKWFTANKVG